MADQWNDGIPALGNQILNDIPDIEETLAWFQLLLQMTVGFKSSTIATVGPPPHRSLFSYGDTDTLNIDPGSYFHDGTKRQVVFWDTTITFDLGSGGDNGDSTDLGASEWHYIYLDDSAIVTQNNSELDADCFLNSTTAPTFSAAKHGWYNGSDRCIFAIYTNGSSQIYNFAHDGGDHVQTVSTTDYNDTPGNSASKDTVTLTIPAFCRKAHVSVRTTYSASTDYTYIVPNGDTTSQTNVGYVAAGGTVSIDNSIVHCDSSLQIQTWTTNGDASVLILTAGWFIPSGM